MKRMTLNAAAVLISVCMILALLEAGFRMFAPQPVKVSVPAILDPELIYRLPPNANGTDVKEEFTVRIKTNSLGLRDREYSPRKQAAVHARILVLGDSMTFAEGVEAEETYPKLLEQWLGGEYEVINAAVRGYGTDQEILLFQQLIPIYHPDVVVLSFFARNDFDDNLYGHLFEAQDDRLVRLPLTEESSPKFRYYRRQSFIQTLPGYQTAIQYSHLMNFARTRWARWEFTRKFETARKLDPAKEDRAWRLTRMLILKWRENAQHNGICPYLLLIPSSEQLDRNGDAIDDARFERVLALAHETGIPVIDPRSIMREASRGSTLLYYPKDRHLTTQGHRVVAAYLQKSLAASGALP